MPAFNYELAGAVLVDAAYMGDKEAAKRHGISTRTVRRYRDRLDSDPRLSAFVQEKKVVADQEWASELPSAIRAAIRFVRDSAKASRLGDPEATGVVAEALKALVEVALTKEILDARLTGQNRPQGQED